jgi:WD40 repeat protein
VQHAHQKGIIHRDLKPSNVLITMLDDAPVVKVIDFGIAKSLGQERLSEHTLFTGFAHMIGTPLYMSPEQAGMSGRDVDTRTDIYALGVLLYEHLTGTTPFDKERLKEASYEEIRRIIREEEPAKPSSRITTLGQAAITVSANRKSEPRRLSQLFRRELDWIVMRALEKDRNRRYETASSFAADVERYLSDEPVQACPPTLARRAAKWGRRHKAVMGAAVTVFLVAVAALAASTWLIWQEKEQTIVALAESESNAAKARATEQEMRRQWYAASINAMQQAWETGQMARLRNLLAETEEYPDRGFEWYYCQRLCHLELRTFIGHRADVTAVSWSPDGRLLATASSDGTAKVWEATNGRELRTLRSHASVVHSVAWSPDGELLATGSGDETVKVWQAASGRELLSVKDFTSPVTCVAWSPDGKMLATRGGDGTAAVWEATKGRRLFTLKKSAVRSICWSPDGKWLATGGEDGLVNVWEATGGRQMLTLPGHTNKVFSVSWSPDGKQLATASVDGTAKVWEAISGKPLLTLLGHASSLWSVSWSPDSKRLATASDDGTAKVWETTGGKQQLTIKGHTRGVLSVSWSPDGNWLATGSEDGTAKIWDVAGRRGAVATAGEQGMVTVWEEASNQERAGLLGRMTRFSPVSWSPNGKLLATTGWDGTVKVLDAANGRESFVLQDSKHSDVSAIAWSPDGTMLATATSGNGNVRLWEAAGGKPLRTLLHGHDLPVMCVSWSPDGKFLASGGRDGIAKVWDATGGGELHILKGHTGGITSISWSPDGARLATANDDRTIKVWDAASGRELFPLQGHTGGVQSVSWSPDGKWLATGSQDGTTKVWEAASGGEEITLKGHSSPVFSVSWSPDSKRLATGSADGMARVWEPHGGRELLSLKGHTGVVNSVSWSPDGKRLATGSGDGTVMVWEAASVGAVEEWARQDQTLEDLSTLHAVRGPRAQGFIQNWLLLLPFHFVAGENPQQALDRQQLSGEAQLRPRPGEQVQVAGQHLVWREHRSPEAVLDFNGVLGEVTNRCVAYAVCYLESDRTRHDLWLQVGSNDLAKVYLNGGELYQFRWGRPLNGLDTVGPAVLKQGTNVLLFKVVNDLCRLGGVCAAGRRRWPSRR